MVHGPLSIPFVDPERAISVNGRGSQPIHTKKGGPYVE